MIKVLENVDLFQNIPKYDLILIGTTIGCALGNGIQRQIALNYPYADRMNKATKYKDVKKMGTILDCKEDSKPIICLMYIVKSLVSHGKETLDYEALDKCLKLANVLYKGKKAACPMIGCSRWDGNGNKDKVLELINKDITNFDLDVYDYVQLSREERLVKMFKEEEAIKQASGYSAYYEAVKKRKEKAEKVFNINGHARY